MIKPGEWDHSAFSSGFRFLHPRVSLDKTNHRSGGDSSDEGRSALAIAQIICPAPKM
jgi:hypothetical protein